MPKDYAYTTLAVLFVVILFLSNIVAVKITALGPLVTDAATLLFPLSYVIGDVLTEVYGYQATRRVVRLGAVSLIIMVLTLVGVGLLPPSVEWVNQDAYQAILGMAPRIVLASIIAYVVGELSNAAVLVRIKQRTQGKYLWMRTIGSTLVGQLLDTVLFVLIAFVGVVSLPTLLVMIVSTYLLKVLIEICCTPVVYRVVGRIQREG